MNYFFTTVYTFSSPTPRVDWERLNGNMPAITRTESFGQELVIENIQYEDQATYECQGINDEAQFPIRQTISVYVECENLRKKKYLVPAAA